VGAVIGSGIFVLTGTAAAGQTLSFASILHAPVLDLLRNGFDVASTMGRPGAGPGIALSFILVALACSFAALCYAELASMIPIAGSAYTYAYATLGELFAWIIGFSAYFNQILDSIFGVHLPRELSEPMFVNGVSTGAWFNLPAFLIIMALTMLLVRGVSESAGANNLMVAVKVVAILIFVFGASSAINYDNYQPFMPNGFSGVMTGAAIVFFSYIGFDSVSTAAEECRNPQRDLPIGIIASLLACTILYVAVALVLTGIANYKTLGNAAPVAEALRSAGLEGLRRIVSVGAVAGMLSVLLVFQFGQARVWFAMSRDRLLPDAFSKVHKRFKTPYISTIVAGILVGIPSGILDIGTLADLTNIGTLFAFIVVSVGVIVLRRAQPNRPRSFRVPLVPVLPLMSIAMCLLLMLSLPLETWLRFVVWLAIGLAIYFVYGKRRTANV
jgi:APA family basic amino acid/polyamine antiporter